MGSSAKRKKEKQKDFQVFITMAFFLRSRLLILAETQAQSWQSQGETGELHRHEFPLEG